MLERLLKVGLVYELAALTTRRVPTITAVVYACRRRPLPVYAASVVVVLAGLATLSHHLLAANWEDAA